MDGARDSAQAVKDANKTPSGTDSGHHEFTLDAGATNAEILAAADALSTHSITTGSRYIDAGGEVHNFRSGKRTYWLITKSEVNVVEPEPDPDPENAGANELTLTGPIAPQVLTQGTAYTSNVAFPMATGIDGTVTYSVTPTLPSSITLNTDSTHADYLKLTGTATEALAQTEFTYTATDTDGDTATLNFNLSVKPSKPTTLAAAVVPPNVKLTWDANSGVGGWEYQVNNVWTEISDSGSATKSHILKGPATSTTYSFQVRSFIGSGDSRVESDASNVASVITPEIFTDMVYTQGELVVMRLPVRDDPYQHRYYISPAPPEGIVFDSVPRMIGWAGVPDKHMAKTTYNYGIVQKKKYGSYSKTYTFTAGVRPMKPAGFTATAGSREATLRWTAIDGVSGWEYQKKEGLLQAGSWTAISDSNASTTSHTIPSLSVKAYTFKVRAFVGTGNTQVDGVESDGANVTPTS